MTVITNPLQTRKQEKFNFFVPLEFEKGGMKIDDNGDMIVEGEASDNTEDADGEFLNPNGFDCSPFLSTGVINWNHQAKKDPNAIIGEPIEAYVNKAGKFYIKGKLYKDDPLAQATYNKAKVMAKNSTTRRLGWSVEGIPLEKDPINPKKIRRALITGVAITHCPKNSNTWLSIVKGDYDGDAFKPIDGDIDIQTLVDSYNTWTGINEGRNKEFYGTEGNIREFLQNNYEDNMHQFPELYSSVAKAMGTTEMAPTTLESVEGQHKTLTKSDVYLSIIKNFDVDLQKAKDIFSFIKTVQQQFFPQMQTQTAKGQISSETLEKAFNILRDVASFEKSLDDGETNISTHAVVEDKKTEDIQKSSESKIPEFKADTSLAENELQKAAYDAFLKSADGFDAFAEEHIRKGHSLSECQDAWQAVVAEMNAKKDGGDTQTLNNIEKSTDTELGKKETEEKTPTVAEELKPGVDIQEVIEKSLEGVTGRFEHLLKLQTEFFGEKFNALATINQEQQQIIKSLVDNTETLEKSLETTLQANNELVGKLNSLPTRGRAITQQHQIKQRPFNKSNDAGKEVIDDEEIEKGNDEKSFDISVKSQRDALMDSIMEIPGYESNKELKTAVNQLEITKSLDSVALAVVRRKGFKPYRSVPLEGQ